MMLDTSTPKNNNRNTSVTNHSESSGDRNSVLVPEGGTKLTVLSGAVRRCRVCRVLPLSASAQPQPR